MNLREKEDPIYLRLLRRLFSGKGKQEEIEQVLERQREEKIQTPMRLILSNFIANKIAMVGFSRAGPYEMQRKADESNSWKQDLCYFPRTND